MAIAKELSEVHPDFIQDCPFCARPNRMVVHGQWILGKEVKQHPDMGYSFCNCKNMFYTWPENIIGDRGHFYEPVDGIISGPDPFFAWPDPYQFLYWDVRKYRIIWPMDSLCEHLKSEGYEILSASRDFNVHSETPQHFHIRVKKP